MGALAIQRRSLSGFSRWIASTLVIFIGLLDPHGRSAAGVSAINAAGAPARAAFNAFRRVMAPSVSPRSDRRLRDLPQAGHPPRLPPTPPRRTRVNPLAELLALSGAPRRRPRLRRRNWRWPRGRRKAGAGSAAGVGIRQVSDMPV